MKNAHPYAFPKAEKLCCREAVEQLFQPGCSRSVAAFPMRLVLRLEEGEGNKVLISVPKKHFRHAVDRNRVKRQIREAYRLNRSLLRLPEGQRADMAILWLDDKHYPTSKLAHKMQKMLQRMTEVLHDNNPTAPCDAS